MAKKKIFSSFSRNSIDKHDNDGLTKLYRAARHGNINLVKSLLKKGANPNVPTDCGLSPLHIASFWGEVKIVELLLAHDADPNIDNGKGWTPLHSASLNSGLPRRPEVIELLEQHDAKKDAQDEHGWSPQDYADLWKGVNVSTLKDVFKQIHNADDNYSDHQPDMKSLNLEKKKPSRPPKIKGDTPIHHNRPPRP